MSWTSQQWSPVPSSLKSISKVFQEYLKSIKNTTRSGIANVINATLYKGFSYWNKLIGVSENKMN